MTTHAKNPKIAVVLKGWPRLSETFIAQELVALEQRGIDLQLWSLRHPTDAKRHALHDQLQGEVRYLPEYLRNAPLRVLAGLGAALTRRGFWPALWAWARDLRRDPTRNRIRRFGQALVLARELPCDVDALYAHFLHTPTSVARYAARIRRLDWGFSAHAKDIWTIPEWEKTEKIAESRFGATCTAIGAEHLATLADRSEKIRLIYHGLDLTRFPAPPRRPAGADWSRERADRDSLGRTAGGEKRLRPADRRVGANAAGICIGAGRISAAGS